MNISDEEVEAAARAVLLMLAAAWDEGEAEGYLNSGLDDLGLPTTPNPYRSEP